MSEAEKPPTPTAAPAPPKRRANDVPTVSPEPPAEDDPERLYTEWRAGKRSLASLEPLIPLNVAFQWLSSGRISNAEFGVLMADLEIHQVDIGDPHSAKAAEPDAEQQRANAVVSAFNARMASFDQVRLQDTISELDLKAVLQARTPLVDGIGFRMGFAKGPDDSLAKPGTTPQLTVLCRAFIASTSMSSTVKCEAVFSAPGMEHDRYCRIVVPLPLVKGGRRRLLVSVLDNETRQPVELPPALADLFHEKYLFDLRLLRKGGTAGLGSAVKGAFGKLFRS